MEPSDSALNPYAAPGAVVADMHPDAGTQPVRTWSARGRIGRLRYVAHMAASYLLYMLAAFTLGLGMGAIGMGDLAVPFSYVLTAVYIVFVTLKTIQRSHDMDWSGWTAIAALIPLVGLIWVFKRGSAGMNSHGAPAPPNTFGVKLLGIGTPVVMVIGILAIIAPAAHQIYAQRTQATQNAR